MKLFCVPYAGGSANGYLKWRRVLDQNVELVPLELKGRGTRFLEEFYVDFDEMVDDLYHNLIQKLDGEAYALFGHSMGALAVYKLVLKMQKLGVQCPQHLFISGREAPRYQFMRNVYPISHLPEQELLKELEKYGGLAKEVIENEELLQILTPIIRSDFRLVEQLQVTNVIEKVCCNVTILNGLQDITDEKRMTDWCDYVDGDCELIHYEGGHFFIDSAMDEVIYKINAVVNDIKKSTQVGR
ncbi:cereulide biosynthesis thioesterase CesT [Bacillus cereus]|uniref:Thioesterase domain-containing protein n=1 Tax=Bacillus cereus MC67 TaxID=1053219 RepID=J8EAG3_BACCE|nr:cereulide biosynthesis thioesterase CesT [Bacillus cereus]EJQ93986.1 hypothetical protein II3_05136 [Bacillus cereus MC67]EOP05709.1 hypothetical protein II1_04396 [Bacillus cereus MC118]